MRQIIYILLFAFAVSGCKPEEITMPQNSELILGSWWQVSNNSYSGGELVSGRFWDRDSTVVYAYHDSGAVDATYFGDTTVTLSYDFADGQDIFNLSIDGTIYQMEIQNLDNEILIYRNGTESDFIEYVLLRL